MLAEELMDISLYHRSLASSQFTNDQNLVQPFPFALKHKIGAFSQYIISKNTNPQLQTSGKALNKEHEQSREGLIDS